MSISRLLGRPARATEEDAAAPERTTKSWPARVMGVVSGAIGTVAGVTPHVLHHVGPIAGAALLTGTGGSVLFGAIGFVLTIPLLIQIKHRFGTLLAPAIALIVFATMFTISTLWIGPAVRDAISRDSDTAPASDTHHGHTMGFPGLEDGLVQVTLATHDARRIEVCPGPPRGRVSARAVIPRSARACSLGGRPRSRSL